MMDDELNRLRAEMERVKSALDGSTERQLSAAGRAWTGDETVDAILRLRTIEWIHEETRRVLLEAIGDHTGSVSEARALAAQRDHLLAEVERLQRDHLLAEVERLQRLLEAKEEE